MEPNVVEKPNGKTSLPTSWTEDRAQYSKELVERVLNLIVEGRSQKTLAKELNIHYSTIRFWVKRERLSGSELGKKLCFTTTVKKSKKPKSPIKVAFEGGSVYTEGNDGEAVLEPSPEEVFVEAVESTKTVQPVKTKDLEESFIDEVFEELAMQLGKKTLEIVILKVKLERAKK